jgi:hypothetical protein
MFGEDYVAGQLARKRRGFLGPALPGPGNCHDYRDRYLLKKTAVAVYCSDIRLDKEYEQQLEALMPFILERVP